MVSVDRPSRDTIPLIAIDRGVLLEPPCKISSAYDKNFGVDFSERIHIALVTIYCKVPVPQELAESTVYQGGGKT
jgi:hypothetical protein